VSAHPESEERLRALADNAVDVVGTEWWVSEQFGGVFGMIAVERAYCAAASPSVVVALLDENERLREKVRELNRRCQSAESGLADKENAHAGPSFGRSLANASASMHRAQHEELQSEVQRLRASLVEATRDSKRLDEIGKMDTDDLADLVHDMSRGISIRRTVDDFAASLHTDTPNG